MANFDLASYEPVEERIRRFWEKFPEGRIVTDIVQLTETGGVFKAAIFTDRTDERPVTVDFAEEVKGSSPVNRTSWVENGITSAIGRALADLGFSPKGSRPSREEMAKVERMNNAPKAADKFDKTEFLADLSKADSRDALNRMWPRWSKFAETEFLDDKDNTVTPTSMMQARAKEFENA